MRARSAGRRAALHAVVLAVVLAVGLGCGLVVSAGTTGQGAPPDSLCSTGPQSAKPQETPRAGCVRAFCTPVGDQTLCSCQLDADGDQHRFERWRGRQRVQAWASEVAPIMGGGAFSVARADVDGDGQPEWLVVRQLGASNGMGVSYQNLCVVWPNQPSQQPQPQPSQQQQLAPLCRDVSEWQSLTLLVREPGRKACSLMDSAWESGSAPRRGPGTYAVGRLHRLSTTAQGPVWTPVPPAQRLPVARRLLDGFAQERATLPQRNAQRLWYQHPAAATVPCPGPMCVRPPP